MIFYYCYLVREFLTYWSFTYPWNVILINKKDTFWQPLFYLLLNTSNPLSFSLILSLSLTFSLYLSHSTPLSLCISTSLPISLQVWIPIFSLTPMRGREKASTNQPSILHREKFKPRGIWFGVIYPKNFNVTYILALLFLFDIYKETRKMVAHKKVRQNFKMLSF